MRMNIYVPDDLGEKVKQHDDINVSAVCQEALRSALDNRAALAKLVEGMGRVTLYIEDRGESAFVGKLVHSDDRGNVSIYITKKHRIAIYDESKQRLYEYDGFAEMEEEWSRAIDVDHAALSAVAEALGEKYVTELDI